MNMYKVLLTGQTLLDRLKDPNQEMSIGDQLAASLQVTVLGVSIVFIALALLYVAINGMERAFGDKKQPTPKPKPVEQETASQEQSRENASAVEQEDQEELIAVITAAIAASMETSSHNIVVRNIVRSNDMTPTWGRAGRVEQTQRMFTR